VQSIAMPQINEAIFAPELEGGEWLQGGPLSYNLVANESVIAGTLTLRAREPGLSVYAFTFVSCAAA
jgi:hypothetical protein